MLNDRKIQFGESESTKSKLLFGVGSEYEMRHIHNCKGLNSNAMTNNFTNSFFASRTSKQIEELVFE